MHMILRRVELTQQLGIRVTNDLAKDVLDSSQQEGISVTNTVGDPDLAKDVYQDSSQLQLSPICFSPISPASRVWLQRILDLNDTPRTAFLGLSNSPEDVT